MVSWISVPSIAESFRYADRRCICSVALNGAQVSLNVTRHTIDGSVVMMHSVDVQKKTDDGSVRAIGYLCGENYDDAVVCYHMMRKEEGL